jgi:hypothetical protein
MPEIAKLWESKVNCKKQTRSKQQEYKPLRIAKISVQPQQKMIKLIHPIFG